MANSLPTMAANLSGLVRISFPTEILPLNLNCSCDHRPREDCLGCHRYAELFSVGWNEQPSRTVHDAEELLLSDAFPAARKAGIQIIHVTWGISDEELAVLPPVIFRAFGYDETSESWNSTHEVENGSGKEYALKITVGDDLGDAKFLDGSREAAGRLLMRDQWNTALHEPLQKEFEKSQASPLPDQRFHKARLSGFWGGETAALRFLKEQKISTLIFAGVNTDQCVLASIRDASNMGFDTILLKDGCATDSPDYAVQTTEYNCRKSWGFVSSCKALREGVESMTTHL